MWGIVFLLLSNAQLSFAGTIDVYGYETAEDMFNFRNYYVYNGWYVDEDKCKTLGGLFYKKVSGGGAMKLFYDSSCAVQHSVVNVTSCTQDDSMYQTYAASDVYTNTLGVALNGLYKRDPSLRFYSFAIPANCRNNTIVSFDASLAPRNIDIGVLKVDVVGELAKKVNESLNGVCDDQFARAEAALAARFEALLAAFLVSLKANLTAVLTGQLNLSNLNCTKA